MEECKATLEHLGVPLPRPPKKEPLAKALFEATAVARKAHDEVLKNARKKRTMAGENTSRDDVVVRTNTA